MSETPVMNDEQKPVSEAPLQTENSKESPKHSRRQKKQKPKKSVGQEILSWVLTILAALAIAIVIRTLVFEPIRVDGESMMDTLQNKEILFVSKWNYSSSWFSLPWQSNAEKESAPRWTLYGSPKQFDPVICRYPGRGDVNFVKRVIGMPGDTVTLKDGYLTVNDTAYDEPYISEKYRKGYYNNGIWKVPAKGDPFRIEYAEDTSYYHYYLADSPDAVLFDLYVNQEKILYEEEIRTGIEYRYGHVSGSSADGKTTLAYYGGNLYINGKPVSRRDGAWYLGNQKQADNPLDAVVGQDFFLSEDYYLVMGDHRNNSTDGRAAGPIPRSMLMGKVERVLFPLGSWRYVPNGLDVKVSTDQTNDTK